MRSRVCAGFPKKWRKSRHTNPFSGLRAWWNAPNPPDKLYHVTSKNLKSIMREGLLPRPPDWREYLSPALGKTQSRSREMPVVWAWDSLDEAREFAVTGGSILEIDVHDELCWALNQGGVSNSWQSPVRVKPENIRVVHHGDEDG